jgi:hypothetical protein
MNLQQQIEKTIQAYEEACKKENRNLQYCIHNQISLGICYYASCNDFDELGLLLLNKLCDNHLCNIPKSFEQYNVINKIKNPTILKCHKARIKFLKQLLKDEHNKKILP